jgi:peptidyl-tRNA hydrolase, PTH1 family
MNEPQENGFLIVGLGNPGREYKGNRHNVGFMALDTLASQFDISFTRIESKALVTKTNYKGKKILLAKPQTYMNLSGQAVGSLSNFYKIPLERILVAYDEVDLPFGNLRLRSEGGSAGHNGLQSIIDQLGTNRFPRLRIGIGRPPGRKGAANYVLKDFSAQEKEILDGILKHASEAVLEFIEYDLETAMNKYNGEI